MAEYVDEDSIAKSLGVPLEIVQGIIACEMPDEAMDQYDPAKPPEIRVVKQKKYYRSNIIGLVSTGGCGASTIAAALTHSLKGALAIDLNEYAYLGNLLTKKRGLTPTALGWARGSGVDFIITPNTNHDLIWGVNDIQEYLTTMPSSMAPLIREASTKYEYLIVDCPGMPHLWEEVFQELDLIIWVNRTDPACLSNFNHLEKLISPFKEKIMVVFNMARKGRYRTIPQKMGLSVIADVPYFDKDVMSNVAKNIRPLIETITGRKSEA
jgi:MinD-like ATPase involved in chromosome partitioning or flagellar assembly